MEDEEEVQDTCVCCGEPLSEEEIEYGEMTCFPCLKGNCDKCK